MKRNLRLLLLMLPCIFFSMISHSQSLSGKWIGINGNNIQAGEGWETIFEITQLSKDSIIGTSTVSNSGRYLKMKFKGSINGTTVVIRETDLIDCSLSGNWIVKSFTGTLKTDTINKQLIIEGKWISISSFQDRSTPVLDNRYFGEFIVRRHYEIPIKKKTKLLKG